MDDRFPFVNSKGALCPALLRLCIVYILYNNILSTEIRLIASGRIGLKSTEGFFFLFFSVVLKKLVLTSALRECDIFTCGIRCTPLRYYHNFKAVGS